MSLPQTINEAYNQILGKSEDDLVTRRALSIVLAASRPLTVSEMNIAVNLDFESPCGLDLEDDKSFETRLRSCSGLFLSIHHGKIYFLHQTAREFLIDTTFSPASSPKLLWHQSITIRSAHALLAKICLSFLNLLNHECSLPVVVCLAGSHFSDTRFLNYSADYWNAHFREANIMDGDTLIPLALRICSPDSRSYSRWFLRYYEWDYLSNKRSKMKQAGIDSNRLVFSVFMVAVHCGHHTLVKFLLAQGADVEEKDPHHGLSILIWSCLSGHESVVKLLLEKGADLRTKDHYHRWTPLWYAIVMEHEAVVRLLLEKVGDIEIKDDIGRTPLLHAAIYGCKTIISLLLEKGADIEVKDKSGYTPLLCATFAQS
jgi:hypothetical protein